MSVFPDSVEKHFSPSYTTARSKFLAASSSASLKETIQLSDVSGSQGEELTIDIRGFGNAATAERVLVHLSGVHGPEGYAGSAIQNYVLETLDPASLGAKDFVIFVHAVNPFGMSWGRRWNENNVDLNRNMNYPNDPEFYKKRGTSALYHKCNNALNPEKQATFPFLSYLYNMGGLLLRHGFSSLKQACVEGQDKYRAGLFFGGVALEEGPRRLFEFFEGWLHSHPKISAIMIIDVHTGLGKKGVDTLLMTCPPEETEALSRKFPGAKAVTMAGGASVAKNSIAYDVQGCSGYGFKNVIKRLNRPVKCNDVTQEFGTHNPIKVLYYLRSENTKWRNNIKDMSVRNEGMNAFYLHKDLRWKQSILARGKIVFEQGMAALK